MQFHVQMGHADYGLFYKPVHLHGQKHGQSSVAQDQQIQVRCTHLWISSKLKEGMFVYHEQASGFGPADKLGNRLKQ